MKTVCILLSVMAIAAGMAVGWLEHEESRNASATSRSDQVIAAPVVASRAEAPGRKRRSWTPGASEIVSLEPEAAPAGPAEPESRNQERPSSSLPAASALPSRLDAISALIAKRGFTEAEKEARALAENTQATAAVRDDALRLAAKARIFARILKTVPPGDGGDATASFEVILANGTTIRVAGVDRTSSRYIFKLPKGTTFSPPKEDVLDVRESRSPASKGAARVEWKDLEQKIAPLDHPIDIFMSGVMPCFQNGFEKEGFALLEKLLARPDSDQVPLLFIPDAGEEVLADWRIAAGRAGPPAGRESSGDLASARPGTQRKPSGEDSIPPDAGTPDPQALLQVAELLGEAQALYRAGAGKEGREAEVRQARERLDRAVEILEPLPAGHESVKKLRRQLAQLLSDVSRAVSF